VRADQQVRGSGLGLAIVSDLAALYGGAVTLETSPLSGTRASALAAEAERPLRSIQATKMVTDRPSLCLIVITKGATRDRSCNCHT
jgi:signal transduction histidine kinase